MHMGRHGLYYRATLPGGPRQSVAEPGVPRPSPSVADESVGLTKIESAEVAQMTDSSAADLLAELNHNRKKARLAPIVAAVGAVTIVGQSRRPIDAVERIVSKAALRASAVLQSRRAASNS